MPIRIKKQVKADGDNHGRHRSCNGARQNAKPQQLGFCDLCCSGAIRPKLRWTGQEAEELGDDVRGEAVNILNLVEPMREGKIRNDENTTNGHHQVSVGIDAPG